jgi:hypothetical protein
MSGALDTGELNILRWLLAHSERSSDPRYVALKAKLDGMGEGLVRAGRSDKYGQVWVERVGSTGFPDPDEPVALMRAQDRLAHRLMQLYLSLSVTAGVPREQIESVRRQITAFREWREANRDKVRTPGRVQEAESSPVSDGPFGI